MINRNVNIVCDDDETVWLKFVYLFNSLYNHRRIDKSSTASYAERMCTLLCQLLVRFRLDIVFNIINDGKLLLSVAAWVPKTRLAAQKNTITHYTR